MVNGDKLQNSKYYKIYTVIQVQDEQGHVEYRHTSNENPSPVSFALESAEPVE